MITKIRARGEDLELRIVCVCSEMMFFSAFSDSSFSFFLQKKNPTTPIVVLVNEFHETTSRHR